jgi:hypothetical protein
VTASVRIALPAPDVDVLTYSAKARKHKQVYPYLRYGVVVSHEAVVPHRFFIHNEALGFFAALKNTKRAELSDFFSRLIKREVETSERMERIAFGRAAAVLPLGDRS